MNYRRLITSSILAVLVILGTFLTALAQEPPPVPDYSSDESWIALPKTVDRPVDVFWIYPTVYHGDPVLAPVDDPQMEKDARRTLEMQAGVFSGSANLFAPLYRQSNISVLHMDPEDKDRYLGVGLTDIVNAFDYYIRNLNQGRPFILAGHSQGSNLLIDLLKRKFGNPDLQKRLVAAYAIGWSVTEDDLKKNPFLRICRDSEQTGCIVAYNCVADGAQEKAPTIMPGSVVVNPLSWTTDGNVAPASENLGSVFFDPEGNRKEAAHFTSAQVKNSGLVVVPADTEGLDDMPFGPGIYHKYDYAFFYRNLEANAIERIEAYLAR